MASDNDDLLDELGDDFLNDEDNRQPATQTTDEWLEETDVPGQLAVDVYQTKENIVVRAPVPGVSKVDLDLSIVDNTLTIHGTRKAEQEVQEGNFFVQECYWGEFSRSIILPVQVKEEEAEAVLKDGMLSVSIPKMDQEKVKKIDIK